MTGRTALLWKLIIYTLLSAAITGWFIHRFYPQYYGLVLLFFYIIPSNSFIPFPHEPAIIYYGKIFGPLATTITAAIPTVIACIIDYQVLTPIFNRTRARKIRETRVYERTVHYYNKAPFFTNLVAALSPVPFYPVRILSVASGYPMWKYTTAVLVGRLPRYYLLALFGAVLNVPNWVIGLFFFSLVSGTLYRLFSKRRERKDVTMVHEITRETTLPVEEKESVPSSIIAD